MKTIELEGVGEVTLKKSPRAKRLILKINQKGEPVVVVPTYVPYVVAEKFARAHREWLEKHTPKQPKLIINEGKNIAGIYTVRFIASSDTKTTSRVTKSEVRVIYPESASIFDTVVQTEAKKGCVRALKKRAEAELPGLLHQNAVKHGYRYKEVRIKTVQSRWGSCSSNRIINLSVWLMQVPHALREYVVCHELAHLDYMHHQPAFWEAVERMIPDYKARRKALKEYHPELI